jgi:hypothetical protein
MSTSYDLLIYKDFTDTFDQSVAIGDDAAKFAHPGLSVVAIGPGIHEGRTTLVLAHGERPMAEIQKLLNGERQAVKP